MSKHDKQNEYSEIRYFFDAHGNELQSLNREDIADARRKHSRRPLGVRYRSFDQDRLSEEGLIFEDDQPSDDKRDGDLEGEGHETSDSESFCDSRRLETLARVALDKILGPG